MGRLFMYKIRANVLRALACIAISAQALGYSTAMNMHRNTNTNTTMPMNGATQCRSWCGNQTIKYPFGFQEGCGRPTFRLYCNENYNTIELKLDSKVFTVNHVDYSNNKLFVRDSHMSDCSGLKQEDPNFRLDWSGVNYTITESTVLLLNCLAFQREIQVNPLNSQYDCKSPACVAFITSCLVDSLGDGVPPTCCELTSPNNLDLQPLQCQSYTSAYSPGKPMYDAKRWNYGLVLEWDYPLEDFHACMDCQRTNGVCGYNVSDLQSNFLCICKYGNSSDMCQDCFNGSCSHAQVDPSPAPVKHKRKARHTHVLRALAIGLMVIAAIVIIPVAVLCLIFFLRKKQQVRIEAADTTSNSIGSFTREEANNQLLPVLLQYMNSTSSSNPIILYSYSEIKDATHSFSESRLLGDGGHGMVYEANFCDGRVAAVKTLHYQNHRRLEQFHNEVRVLAITRHPNLVQLLGFCLEGRDLILVYELLSNGTLEEHLQRTRGQRPLPWETRLSIAIEVAEALFYLHNSLSPPILHRDVKSSNILLDHACHAKLADFGLSKIVPTEVSHVSTAPQGTLGYLDPEYHQTCRLTDKSDVYSFGVVLMEMIAGRKAVDPTKELDDMNLCVLAMSKMQEGKLYENIVDPLLKTNILPRDMLLEVAELALRCVAASRKQRPAMSEVLVELKRIRDAVHAYTT